MIAEGSSPSQTPVPRDGPPAPNEDDLLAGSADSGMLAGSGTLAGSGMLAGSGIRAERVSPGPAERVSPGPAERRAAESAESGETALVRRAEAAEATVKTLETHVASLQRRLDEGERDGRRTSELADRLERVEGALGVIRESHRRMAVTVSELKDVAVRLRAAVDRAPAQVSVQELASPRSEEMAGALAAAVERLRARAETAVPPVQLTDSVAPVVRVPHKHSMSLIGRWRLRRKQRRGR
jgi:hypothetical protein